MTSYGLLNLLQLKEELRKRGAKTSGRKRELVERLEAYDKNDNFGNETVDDDTQLMETPNISEYHDLTVGSLIPVVTRETIKTFLKHHLIPDIPDSAIQMYHNESLLFLRTCHSDNGFYFHAVCKAQYKKLITYSIHILVDKSGELLESQCECAAGKGPTAYCKHVITVLLGLDDFDKQQIVKLAKSKTDKLQSFHHPRKDYTGPPVKAEDLPLKRFKEDGSLTKSGIGNVCFDPRPPEFRNQKGYTDFARNICINYAYKENHFPLLQLYSPANTYALERDHDYCKRTVSDLCLETLKVNGSCTEEYAIQLEKETRLQSRSIRWAQERRVRLTSSFFGAICKATEKKDLGVLLDSIINPTVLNTKPILHGQQYEKVAIDRYEEITGKTVNKCGLFVSQEWSYLAASPDGVVDRDLLVEVKCPYSARNQFITPLTVPYLQYVLSEEGTRELKLKENHSYFYQIQGQLAITKRTFCDLIIFTYQDFVILTIEKNNAFIESMLQQLRNFHSSHFKNALKDYYFYLKRN